MERIRTLGLVFVALGVIEWAWCAFCVFGGGILGIVGFADHEMGKFLWLGSGVYGLLALAAFGMGAVHVAAGVRLRGGKGMILGIVALATCLVSMVLALYCAPFSLAAVVYGLVVYADPECRKVLDGAS